MQHKPCRVGYIDPPLYPSFVDTLAYYVKAKPAATPAPWPSMRSA